MILEIDYGNTRLKWRLLDAVLENCIAKGAVSDVNELFQALHPFLRAPLKFCRICSVRSLTDNNQLTFLIGEWFRLAPIYAVATERLAGVVSGYLEPGRLGVDRWLAVVGAYQQIKSACVIFDCGTALTADYINREGVHLGGCIAPGRQMMIAALSANAQQLTYFDGGAMQDQAMCGTDTRSAILCGISTMLQGFVREQLLYASSVLGVGFQVVCTGGDRLIVSGLVADIVLDEDLVFKGLAFACPYYGGE